jgi:hypothetical protein
MQQFHDGSFGPVQPADELLKALVEDRGELMSTAAVHFGTQADLEAVRAKADTPADARLDDLAAEVAALKARVNEATKATHTAGVRVYPASALPS